MTSLLLAFCLANSPGCEQVKEANYKYYGLQKYVDGGKVVLTDSVGKPASEVIGVGVYSLYTRKITYKIKDFSVGYSSSAVVLANTWRW